MGKFALQRESYLDGKTKTKTFINQIHTLTHFPPAFIHLIHISLFQRVFLLLTSCLPDIRAG